MTQIDVIQAKIKQARQELSSIVVGQEDILDALFISILSQGHILLIGVPGLAKTLIVHSLAKVFDGSFNRIQFTPDLMPSDITGIDLIQENKSTGERSFHFIKGPVFCNILLADEINRTPPKTQAALLQAMQEKKISQGDHTFDLPSPFFVLATQNPIEQEGTYPLPEAQLDRFTFSLQMKYPSFEDEVKIATLDHVFSKPLQKVMNASDLKEAQSIVEAIPIGDEIVRFAVKINHATRADSEYAPDIVKNYITWGSGPRASQFMIKAAKARAFLDGRNCASAEDISFVAPMVLQHRLVMNFQGEAEGLKIQDIIQEIIRSCK